MQVNRIPDTQNTARPETARAFNPPGQKVRPQRRGGISTLNLPLLDERAQEAYPLLHRALNTTSPTHADPAPQNPNSNESSPRTSPHPAILKIIGLERKISATALGKTNESPRTSPTNDN